MKRKKFQRESWQLWPESTGLAALTSTRGRFRGVPYDLAWYHWHFKTQFHWGTVPISISFSSFSEVVFFFHAEGQKAFFHLFPLPNLYVSFYILGIAATSPGFERTVLYTSCPVELSGTVPSGHQSQVLLGGISCVGHVCPPLVIGLWWPQAPWCVD